jgi:hypothetical protein
MPAELLTQWKPVARKVRRRKLKDGETGDYFDGKDHVVSGCPAFAKPTTCAECGEPLQDRRSHSRTCTARCRQRASRRKRKAESIGVQQ